jgi:hypothetical protein
LSGSGEAKLLCVQQCSSGSGTCSEAGDEGRGVVATAGAGRDQHSVGGRRAPGLRFRVALARLLPPIVDLNLAKGQ